MDYYWYDHLQREVYPTIVWAIERAIKNQDYNSFMFFYNNQKELGITLPEITEEEFNHIEFSEFECG